MTSSIVQKVFRVIIGILKIFVLYGSTVPKGHKILCHYFCQSSVTIKPLNISWIAVWIEIKHFKNFPWKCDQVLLFCCRPVIQQGNIVLHKNLLEIHTKIFIYRTMKWIMWINIKHLIYTFASRIKIFKYWKANTTAALHYLWPHNCFWSSSPFNSSPAGHIITGDTFCYKW